MFSCMNTVLQNAPREDQDAPEKDRPSGGSEDAGCRLIITVESGVVADILPTEPIKAVIVDLDMIENDDTFEQRLRKAILPMVPDGHIGTSDIPVQIESLVREYRRPERRKT
jgi:hypothetical protein